MEDKKEQSRSEKVMRELTADLWGEIGKRLRNTIDIQMFRATSKTFRDHLPSPFPSIFPLEVPPLTCVSTDPRMNFYIIEHTGHLLKSDLNNTPCFLRFEKNPESDGRAFFTFQLFPNDCINNTPRSINLDIQELPISMIFKTYYLTYRSIPFEVRMGENYLAQKVLLSSYFSNTNQCVTSINPQFAINEPGVDLAVIVLLNNGTLAHVTLIDSTGWKTIASSSRFDDIINYGGRLWGVDTDGGAYVMHEYKSMKMTRVAESPISNISRVAWLEGRKRLIESSGKLYMLYPYSLIENYSVTRVMVFKLNSEKGTRGMYEWVEVESIGNKTFFVGHGFSFSIDVGGKLSNLIRNNSIYLNGLSFHQYSLPNRKFPLFKEMLNPGPTLGVYSLMDKKFSNISPDECPPI